VSINDYFVVIWTDSVPAEGRLGGAARARTGQLLAAGPVYDVSEQDSRPAPAGMVVARFADAGNATSWFAEAGDEVDGTALLVGGATDPVLWPPEMEARRPEWSRRAAFPADRLALFVCIWFDPIFDPGQFVDYSTHYRWTVEDAGGVVLVPGARPSQVVLRGGTGPLAMGLMAWPADDRVRDAWYEGPHYRAYREQRHRASRTTNVSVRGLSHDGEGLRR
jgi:uncharacterized protein (DUF1330 family)